MRHNSVRDTIAFFLREAKFRDVKVKPGMISVNASHYKRSTITQDDARLDVSAVGVYSSFEHSFLNIRVTHPNCASNEFKDLKHIYKSKKKSRKMHTKKGLYKQRKDHLCLSYLPHLEEWVHFIKQLVKKKLAYYKNERTSIMKNHVRTRLRFAILKSTVIALRGARGKDRLHETGLDDVSLGLVPNYRTYEMP